MSIISTLYNRSIRRLADLHSLFCEVFLQKISFEQQAPERALRGFMKIVFASLHDYFSCFIQCIFLHLALLELAIFSSCTVFRIKFLIHIHWVYCIVGLHELIILGVWGNLLLVCVAQNLGVRDTRYIFVGRNDFLAARVFKKFLILSCLSFWSL